MEYDIEATIEMTIEADNIEEAEEKLQSMLPLNSSCEVHSIVETKQP